MKGLILGNMAGRERAAGRPSAWKWLQAVTLPALNIFGKAKYYNEQRYFIRTLPVKAQNDKICKKFRGNGPVPLPPWLCLWLQEKNEKKEQYLLDVQSCRQKSRYWLWPVFGRILQIAALISHWLTNPQLGNGSVYGQILNRFWEILPVKRNFMEPLWFTLYCLTRASLYPHITKTKTMVSNGRNTQALRLRQFTRTNS